MMLKGKKTNLRSANKVYLLGGSDIGKNDSEELDKKIFSELGDSPIVSVLSWASENPESEKSIGKRDILKNHLTNLGAKKINIISINDSFEDMSDKVNDSEMLYIAGGATENLLEHIREKGIADIIKDFEGTIVGNSAGALCLCKDVIMTSEQHAEAAIEPGLGIVDFSVEVHYKATVDDELLKLSKDRKVYAIPERTALIVDGEKLSRFGDEIYLFENEKKIKFENEENKENKEFKVK
jgi:peptidase E